MEEPRPYDRQGYEQSKDSIEFAQGYKDIGLEAYVLGLNISSFEDFEGKRVLDLGAGAHLQFKRGLEKAGIHADVVSLSPAFADQYWRDGISDRKNSDLVVAAMGEELPFPDDSFDRVVSLDVPEHLGSYERYILYLREIARVLALGGIAYIGPVMERGQHEATVVPEKQLEEILGSGIDVAYHSSHEVHPYKTLVLRKR